MTDQVSITPAHGKVDTVVTVKSEYLGDLKKVRLYSGNAFREYVVAPHDDPKLFNVFTFKVGGDIPTGDRTVVAVFSPGQVEIGTFTVDA